MAESLEQVYDALMEFWAAWEKSGWNDEKAMMKLFGVFEFAYKYGHCGSRGWNKLATVKKRKGDVELSHHLVTGDILEKHLRMFANKKKAEHSRRIAAASAWWEAWTLGFDLRSNGITRRYVLRSK